MDVTPSKKNELTAARLSGRRTPRRSSSHLIEPVPTKDLKTSRVRCEERCR